MWIFIAILIHIAYDVKLIFLFCIHHPLDECKDVPAEDLVVVTAFEVRRSSTDAAYVGGSAAEGLKGEMPRFTAAMPSLAYPSARRPSSSRISRRSSLPTLDLGSMSRNSIY